VTPDQLRYLVATLDHGSMTTAGRALHVAQPALSRSIRRLERELRVSLFVTQGRGLRPTETGLRIGELARQALAAFDAIAVAAADAQRVLLLASTSALEVDIGSRILPGLLRRRPELSVRIVHAASTDEVADAVRSHRVELGFAELPGPEDLEELVVAEEEVVLLSPPKTRLSDPVTMVELAQVRFIFPTVGTPRRVELDHFFASIGVQPRVVVETDDRAAWMELPLQGVGSTMTYRSRTTRAVSKGAVVSGLGPAHQRSVGLLFRRGEELSPAARAVRAAAASPS
jgi:LysR family cyn operon transcriptional activator